ncbi:MAG: hypothetical protein D6791_06615 [Chloroflexi bacterium]|nr:MAG: hypothetical protein D6791_06615 [Chloroflexota bacterium]
MHFVLIAGVLLGAWAGASRLFGRRRSQSRGLVPAFAVEALSWLIVFLLGLTVFAGSAFWTAAIQMEPIALTILGIGVAGILIASSLVALLRDPAGLQATNVDPAGSTWEDRWRDFRWKKVDRWMRSVDLGDGINIDGQLWTVNREGVLVPADQGSESRSLWDWLRWLLE